MPKTAPQQKRVSGEQPASEPVVRAAALPVSDPVYGVVSVLYHALQGAQTYGKYIADAQRAGDDELVKFFEQCRDQESKRATRAQQLLVDRTEIEDSDEDDEEDDDDEE
jgi:hypothetical protein